MSISAYSRTPAPKAQPKEPIRLRVVASPSSDKSFMPFVITCALILCAAMGLSLLLHTQMATTAYESFAKETELAILQEENAILRLELLEASAPNVITQKAQELGMVPSVERHEISLSGQATQEAQAR